MSNQREHLFRCAGCQRIFSSSTPTTKVESEFEELYGFPEKEAAEEIVSVCDTCYALVQALVREGKKNE